MSVNLIPVTYPGSLPGYGCRSQVAGCPRQEGPGRSGSSSEPCNDDPGHSDSAHGCCACASSSRPVPMHRLHEDLQLGGLHDYEDQRAKKLRPSTRTTAPRVPVSCARSSQPRVSQGKSPMPMTTKSARVSLSEPQLRRLRSRSLRSGRPGWATPRPVSRVCRAIQTMARKAAD